MGQVDIESNEPENVYTIYKESHPKKDEVVEADFETAIEATKFGKFNLLLFFVAIPCCWTAQFESTTMSFVFPAAQCDLDLSLDDKGLLNAITYSGMICSGFMWGFLSDALGRKNLLICGYVLDFCFAFMNGFTQTFEMLVVSKFFGGFIINGPAAALTTYLSEFHYAKYRARVSLAIGLIYNIGYLLLPLMAWAIFQQNINFSFLDGRFEIHSWNIFLFICSLPSLVGLLIFVFFMPESAKYLMTAGRNDEALEVFKKVYRINTGRPANTYPIKSLIDERKLKCKNKNKMEALKEGFVEMRKLFRPPHVAKVILICTTQLGLYLGHNTLKLWLPQIFTALNDYEYYNEGKTSNLCEMLDSVTSNSSEIASGSTEIPLCYVNIANDQVYVNTIIVAVVSIVGYISTGLIINIVGKKPLIFTLTLTAGCLGGSLYFAQDTITTLILSSLYVSLLGISIDVIVGVIIDAFPTSLRTMSLSTTAMFGRIGAMSGNLIFPVLLNMGCLPPFLLFGCFPIVCAFLSLSMPKTDFKPLE